VLPKPEVKPAASVLPKPAAKPAVHKPSRPVLPPGSLPSGNLRPLGVSAEAELTAARTGPGALDPLPAETTETRVAVNGSHVDGTPVNGSAVNGNPVNGHDHGAPAEPAPEAMKVRRLVPVSPAEELDSHFGGLTTRIGRWLESLSVKRAR
ncbi:MAG TPA: hypothetical protein VLE45_14705, partial [Burkholderiaceae bacterium]|nr:hypothetical protein [Burkholderiaceae bacterium]